MKVKTREWIIGIDEVGRGPIAGPVTVCAFISNSEFDALSLFKKGKIKDSKKMSKSIRIITNQSIRILRKSKLVKINFAITSRSAKYVDKHGIVKCIDSCIESCIKALEKKSYPVKDAKIYLDGGLSLKKGIFDQETIVKGDEKIAHIAAASILAKVHRDNHMKRLAKDYPEYGLEVNMGYGTKTHYDALKIYGLTEVHRRSFLGRILPKK